MLKKLRGFGSPLKVVILEFKAKLCLIELRKALNSNEPDKTELTEY
jgi:hypothetical protein